MRGDTAFWAAYCAGSAVLFYEADRRGVPFCGVIRRTFHAETPAGRLAIFGSLGIAAGVFGQHLVKVAAESSS